MIEEEEARLDVKAANTTKVSFGCGSKGRQRKNVVTGCQEREVDPTNSSTRLQIKKVQWTKVGRKTLRRHLHEGGPQASKHPFLIRNHFSLVSIRKSLEGVWIHHSLVVHQLVAFVIRQGAQFIGFRVPHDLVAFDDLGLTWFLPWLLDFVQDILTHDVVIQLGFAFAVEAETPHLAFNVTILGLVAIVLGTA